MKITIFIGLVFLILSCLGYFYFFREEQSIQPLMVRTVNVKYGAFTASTLGRGKIVVRKKEQLVSLVDGVVIDRGTSIGQFISEGEIIAFVRLNGPELRQKKREFEYALLDLKILNEQVLHSEELYKAKAISERELKELKIRKYKQEKYVQNLREEISDKPIKCSFSGMVIEKSFQDGDNIRAGTPLALIADTSSFAVEILVDQHQIPFIRLDQYVQYESKIFNGYRWGKVVEIARSAVDMKSNQYGTMSSEPEFTILASIKTKLYDNILIGAQVESRFIMEEKEGVLSIPIEAIIYRNDTTLVFVTSKGRARKKVVKTGLTNDRSIELIDGLTKWDSVITTGNLDVEDGSYIISNQIGQVNDKSNLPN
ncbi:MAG: efflux RND transporter periplasmic adaptor subunit [Bacteroidota bacterium]|nr:efflux RND transporter periplasmic adaptor subunit [Bacteroidota bacterium]MDP4195013.1 efflux RND transporter periplasmic adaptor subunit [Bacteroidota bacterium]